MSYLILLVLQIINCVFGSYKKGVVHWADDYECDDFKVLNNMAWWYDYRPNLDTYYKNKICDTPVGDYIQTFVPMIWGKKSNTSIPDIAKYLLGFNEPNHINQANMTATEAANYWVSQIKPLKINGLPKLASPSAAPCGKNCVDDRDTWFKDFFNKCKDCEIDYLATHTYMCNANQVMRHLERLHANYSLPIWLTEFACGDETDETLMLNFMKEVLPRLEAAPFVYRYSWYKARITKDHYVKKAASLLDPLRTSNLTPLGIFYNGFEGTVQVDGVWAEWSVWSACEVSCGGGQTTRSRQCVYPNKLQKDLPCIGVSDENKSCNTQSCPTTDGLWGQWEQWSICGVTCGGGERSRSRTCIYSDQANKGESCDGLSTATETCNSQACPFDGVWGQWEQWSICGVTCGGGERSRSRTCIYSDQANKGESCDGLSTATEICNTQACPLFLIKKLLYVLYPVDGVWGQWEQWSICGVTCGGGERSRSRTCIYSDQANKGESCDGLSTATEICNTQACPFDGVWGQWEQWSTCGVTCGGGERSRSRTCIYSDQANKGEPCNGLSTATETCNSQACPADGMWGDWSIWSQCSVNCGQGIRKRTRTCLSFSNSCDGPEEQSKKCAGVNCRVTVDGTWKQWSHWSSCSKTCGVGIMTRTRICWWPTNVINGKDCYGSKRETKPCPNRSC
ncbi:coadhesin-like [Mercenaria mercenaria]|uniref:coadhesin-like n=1 Tax=Mercenaria mercenaria TaxID=6596 RepID=UPI00234EFB16|nr:coadhesin-like [Mercenaria mercenaria]